MTTPAADSIDLTLSPATAPPRAAGAPPFPRAELAVIGAIFAALLALRLLLIFHFRIDSDEPQHLHVAWGWAHGMVQYRDCFDNHTPLFHLLMAPLVGLLGDRAHIVILMRLVMLVPFAVMLWAFYDLLRRFFGRRAGLWAAAALALYPSFFIATVEFRTDELWAACWMLALRTLLGGPWSRRRALAGGLLLGATLGSSMKTVLMLGSLGGAAALLPLVSPQFRRAFSLRRLGATAGALLAGLALIPGLLALLLAALGAWRKFIYCTITHNIIEAKSSPYQAWWHLTHNAAVFVKQLPAHARYDIPLFVLGVLAARRLSTTLARTGLAIQASFMCLTTSFAFLLLRDFWPVVQVQTLIPFFPLFLWWMLMLPLLPFAQWPAAPRRWAARLPRWIAPALAVPAAALCLMSTIQSTEPLRNDAGMHVAMLADVIRLTDPGEPLLDAKGETVLRRRPYYYVLERFTVERLRKGLLPDKIAQIATAAGTHVVIGNLARFPQGARRFINANYLSVGQLSVAGKVLTPAGKGDGRAYEFDLAIPARYSLVTPAGAVTGRLDGLPCTGAMELAAGHHTFVADRAAGTLTLIWTRALERGFSPFKPGPMRWTLRENV